MFISSNINCLLIAARGHKDGADACALQMVTLDGATNFDALPESFQARYCDPRQAFCSLGSKHLPDLITPKAT
jgi:hypothetical protein